MDSSLTIETTDGSKAETQTPQAPQAPQADPVTPELTPEEQARAEILNDTPEPPPQSKPRVSKFGEAAPSEAELMGLDEPAKEEEAKVEDKKPEKPEEQGKKAESKGESEKEPDKPAESAEEESKSDGSKPPKGYVKYEALHEARIINKALNSEIDRLKRELEVLSQIPVEESPQLPSGLPKDFKVLTEDEEDALMNEDIVIFNKYQRDLKKYTQFKEAEEKETVEHSRIADASRRKMAELVPDLFDEESDTNANLTQFASEHGIDPSVLSILTDPSVKIIIPGSKKPVSMGPAAVAVVDFLNKVHQKVKSAPQEPVKSAKSSDKPPEKPAKSEQELRKELTSELTEEITKRVTKELMEKLNKNQTSFRSIGDAPAQGDIPGKSSYGESDFRKMTPEQRRQALGG